MNKINKKMRLSIGLLLSIITLCGLFVGGNSASAQYAVPSCTSVTLNGDVTPNGAPTTVWFEWGSNNSITHTTPTQTFTSNSNFSQRLSGLQENSLYSYRAMASNQNGTATGSILTFRTSNCTQATPAPEVSLTADNSNVSYGGNTTLRWNSNNATSCTASGGTNGWSGNKNTNGSSNSGSLTNTTTYNITCTNSSGSDSDSVTVSVSGQVQNPTVSLTADNSNVSYGGNTTVRWNSNNSTSCNASGGTNGWSGSRNTSGSFYTGALTNNTTFNITCSNSSGSVNDSVTISVSSQPVQTCQDPSATNYGGSLPCRYPTQTCQDTSAINYGGSLPCRYQTQNNFPNVELRADDDDIDFDDNTIIRWDSDDADSCTASNGTNGWSGSRSTSGSFNTGPLTRNTSYSIICRNSSGSDSDSITISVEDEDEDDEDEDEDDPTVSLRADDTNLDSGDTTILRWSSTDADSCRATGGTNGWSGNKNRSGSFNTGSLDNTEDYRITCSNDSGSDDDSVTIRVSENLCQDTGAINYRSSLPCRYNTVVVNNQPTVSITADQTNIAFNAATTVRWNTVNATSCFASGGSQGWAGAKSIGPGSFYTGSLTGTATYNITCSNGSSSATDAVVVTVRGQVITTPSAPRPAPTSLVLITSSVDRNQPIVPTIDNTRPHPGDEINYTVSYQNIGNASITNLNLRIDLPYEVDYMFSTPSNPIRSGNTLIFSLGTLRANGQGTVTVRVRVRENIPAGTNFNFPAILTYTDPSGFPQSVNANVYAQVWSAPEPVVSIQDDGSVFLGANVLGAGFLPGNIFGWLLLLILILVLILLAKYLFANQGVVKKTTVTTVE